ncbi:MAG TPA: PilZ domain-containing protein [Candidatus Udaeobacter sp.]|nr:PilZ domain-containing protein [Candidatus Udaeobacter sp.]
MGYFGVPPMKPDGERRSGTRIPTRVATRVRTTKGIDHTAETRDVSANGVFLYTNSKMEKGAEVELVLILPPELTSGEKCWVCCQATIVRVEEDGSDFGVAAQIRRMDILPEMAV